MSGRRNKRSRWTAPAVDETRVRSQVSDLFGRRFEFERPTEDDWRLPDEPGLSTEEDWKVPELQTMKEELNGVKSMLSDKDIIAWHTHTCATSRAGLVVAGVKKHVKPEMATQAWCKFYELLSLWSVLPDGCEDGGDVPLRSLHLCEAPGAFIAALNHYCVLNGVQEWEWRASTLNPYHEGNPLSQMISDDRFILHTLERWEFGADDTGDLMSPENAEQLLKTAGKEVNLVTADGSIDCQGQPAEQEGIVSSLHLCEVLVALKALQPGGTLVIKMFTFYETSSVCLLYILNCCFQQVTVVKPSCSKAGNSEVYVICRRRVAGRPSAALLADWWGRYGTQTRPLLDRGAVPESFIKQLVRCAGLFKSLQEAEISRNLALFEANQSAGDMRDTWAEINAVRREAVTDFMYRCVLTPIDKQLWLTHPRDTRLHTSFQMENKSGSGTYEQRTVPRSPRDRLQAVAKELTALPRPSVPVFSSFAEDVFWHPAIPSANPSRHILGRRPARLLASKFCCLHHLRLHQRAVEAVSELQPGLLATPGGAEIHRTVMGVRVAFPWRAEPWLCDAATVTTLRDAARLLQPGDTLTVAGLYLLHRLNISLLQLMAAASEPDPVMTFATGAVLLLPDDDGDGDAPPQPAVALRAIDYPQTVVALLETVLPLMTDPVMTDLTMKDPEMTSKVMTDPAVTEPEVTDQAMTETCLSLLPLTDLCRKSGAEYLTAYNGRLLRAVTDYLLKSVGVVREKKNEVRRLGEAELRSLFAGSASRPEE